MRKTLTRFLLIWSVLLLSWCVKKYTTEIEFDQFVLKVTSENAALEEITGEKKAIFENDKNLYKIYTIMNKSWFSDSILISKEEKNTQILIERIMQINIKQLENKLKWFEAESVSKIDINCGENKITWYLQAFSIDSITPKNMIYTNQYYFEYKWYMYIISASTENSSNHDKFKKWIKNIKCTTF